MWSIKKIIVYLVIAIIYLSINACGNKTLIDNTATKIKPIQPQDFELSDGKNVIKLDSAYLDFKIDKPEEKLDNNYVGEIYSGEYIYN